MEKENQKNGHKAMVPRGKEEAGAGAPSPQETARLNQALGQAMAFNFTRAMSTVAYAASLRELHEEEKFKALGYRSFKQLCEENNINRPGALELIKNLDIYGEEFMEIANGLRLTQSQLRSGWKMERGERPRLLAGKLHLKGKIYDPAKPSDQEALRDLFEATGRDHEKEKKKLAREAREEAEHLERQIEGLAKKKEKAEAKVIDLGAKVDGMSHPILQLVEMAKGHFDQGGTQLTMAVNEALKSGDNFRAVTLAEIIGAGEAVISRIEFAIGYAKEELGG